jgi:hypothetical protein
VVSLSKFGYNVGSSNLPSRFSTSASSNQSSSTQQPHVPCDPTNASTIGASGFVELGTLGATSYVELQGTLGATNFTSLCSSSGRSVYSTQSPTFGI